MSKKRMLRRAVVGIVAMALGTVAFSARASGGNALTLYQHDTDQAFLDLGAPGRGVGDQYIFGGDLFDRQGGTKVGRSAGHCATSTPSEMLCAASLSITDGQITLEGLVDIPALSSSQPVAFAVTGGTGRHRKASGTVTITIVPGVPTDATVVVDLH